MRGFAAAEGSKPYRLPCLVLRRREDAKRRVAFARKELRTHQTARGTLFSDEKMFVAERRRHAWVHDGLERPREKPCCRLRVWGVIGVGFKMLVIVRGHLNSTEYVKQVCVPFAKEYHKKKRTDRFMQDGARCHTAQNTTRFLTNKKIPLLEEWPPRSPHLNPIETLWAAIQRQVSGREPMDAKQLEEFVFDEWDKFDQKSIDRYVMSYNGRLKKALVEKE